MDAQDSRKQRIHDILKNAQERATSAPPNSSYLNRNEAKELITLLSKSNTAELSEFVDSKESRIVFGKDSSNTLTTMSFSHNLNDTQQEIQERQKTQDIIYSKIHTKELSEILEKNNLKDIKNHVLDNKRHLQTHIYNGEDLTPHKEKVKLLKGYLDKTKSQDNFISAEKINQQHSILAQEAYEAKQSTQEILNIGIALTQIRNTCQTRNIPVSEMQKVLTAALAGKNTIEPMRNSSLYFRLPIEIENNLNHQVRTILCQRNAKKLLEPHGEDVLHDFTLGDLKDKFYQSRNNFQQKDIALKNFEKEHNSELNFYNDVTAIERVMLRDQHTIEQETKKREAGKAQDMDKAGKTIAELQGTAKSTPVPVQKREVDSNVLNKAMGNKIHS